MPGSLALTVSALDGNRGHWDQLLENLDGVTNTQVRLIKVRLQLYDNVYFRHVLKVR